MAVRFIDFDGEKLAAMPIADYERLVAEMEDRVDLYAAIGAENRRQAGEEYLPAEFVDRLLAGEAPLRAWRKHRGMTLKALGDKAGISIGYLSQLERGERAGTPRFWRGLAVVLGVAVDDILPHDPE